MDFYMERKGPATSRTSVGVGGCRKFRFLRQLPLGLLCSWDTWNSFFRVFATPGGLGLEETFDLSAEGSVFDGS